MGRRAGAGIDAEASAVAAPPAMIGADACGRLIIWTEGAADLVGHAAADVVGREVELLVPHEFRARHGAGFAAAMAGGPRTADQAPFHLPVLAADGSVIVCAVRFVFLDDPSGRPAGAVLVLRRADPGAEAFSPVATGDPS